MCRWDLIFSALAGLVPHGLYFGCFGDGKVFVEAAMTIRIFGQPGQGQGNESKEPDFGIWQGNVGKGMGTKGRSF